MAEQEHAQNAGHDAAVKGDHSGCIGRPSGFYETELNKLRAQLGAYGAIGAGVARGLCQQAPGERLYTRSEVLLVAGAGIGNGFEGVQKALELLG